MRRWVAWLGLAAVGVALLACGGDGDSSGDGDDGVDPEQTVEAVDTDELSYLTLNGVGVYRVEAESGEGHEVATWADLGLPFGETLTLPQLQNGLLWGALGPGHLIAIDVDSGDVEVDLEFASTQTISDFGFAGGLVWVQVGFAFADAVLLGLDRSSGEIVFVVEPPAGTTIGGMAAGDEGVWLIGGDPESVAAISRVDTGSGTVTGTFDTGVNVRHLALAFGSVWAGGGEFAFEGGDGSSLARLDPESGEILETIETGEELAAVLAYSGAMWVADSMGADSQGAELLRIDPATNAITETIDVGGAGRGGFSLLGGGGYIWGTNPSERATFVVNAETVEGEAVVTGPTNPVAIP